MKTVAIVTPVLNDWESLGALMDRIVSIRQLSEYDITMIAVDDGSVVVEIPQLSEQGGCLTQIRVIKLNANQGHQRAIAVGLAYVHRELKPDIVIVMDSDGEDRPENLLDLIEAHKAAPASIIVAQRKRRSEGLGFKLFYQIYKQIFAMLTGKLISFGNFSLIPFDRLPNVIFSSGIWNNFAATILKARIPIKFVGTDRGERYFGASKMNFTSLLIHGFSAISVFTDIVIGRIMSFLVAASVAVGVGVAAIVVLKFATSIFVPGYATYLIMFLLTILAVALFTGFLAILSLLASRDQASTVPSQLLDELVRETIEVSVSVTT